MLCCALIALLSGQPAVFLAAVRARLFMGHAAGSWRFLRPRALGLSVAIVAELALLGTGSAIAYAGFTHAQLNAPAGLLHRAICSIFPAAKPK